MSMFSQAENLPKGLYRFQRGGCFSKNTALTIFDRTGTPMFVMKSRTRWNLFSAFFEEIRCRQEVKWRYVSQKGYWDGEKRKVGLYDANWTEAASFQYHKNRSFPMVKPSESYYISIKIWEKECHFFYTANWLMNNISFAVRDEQFCRIFYTSIEKTGLFSYEYIGTVHVEQEQPFLLMSILIPLALYFRQECGSDNNSLLEILRE